MRFARLPVGVLTLLLAASRAQAQIAQLGNGTRVRSTPMCFRTTTRANPQGDQEFFELLNANSRTHQAQDTARVT